MRKFGITLIVVGLLAVLAGAGLYAYNAWDDNRAALASEQIGGALFAQIMPIALGSSIDSAGVALGTVADNGSNEAAPISYEGETYIGIISLPTLRISLPINSDWDYTKLKKSPCRYAGSVADNDLVIAAHNYKRHFGNISTLQAGDPVAFTDSAGIMHEYAVVEVTTVEPTQTWSVISGTFDLTLFTCTYGGQARWVVRCNRV